MQKGKEFSSFEELEAALKELQNVYHHPLRVFNSQTVRDTNRRREKSKSLLELERTLVSSYIFLTFLTFMLCAVFNF